MRIFIKRYGPCAIRPHTRYFHTLVGSIISQQLSTKAADTIHKRFLALYAPSRSPKPAQILETPDETLRACGLSFQKIGYIKDIAAKTEDGPCVTYIGPGGAGHFVKMVHNGIEYGDMQLIAEAYDMMRNVLGMEADEMADIFDEWNRGDLESFLIEITAQILRVKDEETGQPLVNLILDKAGQKGTGKWTSQLALDLGIVIPTIDASIVARSLSSRKDERVEAGKQISGPSAAKYTGDKQQMIAAIHDALYASKICSYAQGMNLIREASDQWNWGINLGEVSRIWKAGCIIRAQFLDRIKQAYVRRADLPNLLLDPDFKAWVEASQANWRLAVTAAMSQGVPVLAMAASLNYFDMYRTANLPLNLTQGQRDFFGSHTYERVDKPELGAIHTEWEEVLQKQSKA